MPYHIHEGRFDADCLEDRSVNILTLAVPDGEPLNLVVSRDTLRPGEDLKSCLNRQIKELSRSVQAFEELGREGGWLGPGDDASYPAIVLYTRFKQGGKLFFQAQCLAQLPQDKLLVLTLTSPSAFDDALRARWKKIILQFVPALNRPVAD
ncbi:MAG: DUF1795 domain-containing protein [Azoarcus sp.]|jgi:hypothetical protein|nr:DUF1795 domain-containing protein [Azoarcus sp.]